MPYKCGCKPEQCDGCDACLAIHMAGTEEEIEKARAKKPAGHP